MKYTKKLWWFCFWGFCLVSILGTFSHFLYEFSGNNLFVGIFFPANESIWEHLKMTIFPTLLFFICANNFIKSTNFFFAMFISLLTPIILIPVIFYSYTSISHQSILAIDIISFYLCVFLAFLFAFLILKQERNFVILETFSYFFIVIIVIAYFTFTLFPPKVFLFEDPTNGSYGFKNLIYFLKLHYNLL